MFRLPVFLGKNARCGRNALLSGLIVASVLFGGCSSSDAANDHASPASSSNIPAAASGASMEQSAASKPLTDARNTPAVRAAKAIGPTVVGITNKAVARDWFNNPVETQGVGSGVIFKADGYIVTNNHVVSGAKEIIVSLADGRTFQGKVIGADELSDIAVVKVDGKDLPVAAFGNSDDIVVGEPAIAIGNPMGLEFQGSVTAGVISALNRTLDISGDRRIKLIQTDAAINPGNSGGALVNADGEVIGINSAKVAANGIEGMGFSIPINTVRTIVDELMQNGYIARPYLGVGIIDKKTAPRMGYELNVDKGVYILRMTLGGPADKAGLQRGDLILEVDGKETNTVSDVRGAIAEHKVGDTISVTYERDGRKGKLDVTLEEIPQEDR